MNSVSQIGHKLELFQFPHGKCLVESEHHIPDFCKYNSTFLSQTQWLKNVDPTPPTSIPVISTY